MPTDQKPSYYKVHRDLWRSVDDLPFPQNAKLLYALIRLFFENVEPSERELPREARRIYFAKRQDVLSYRRNVLNGKRNHGGRRLKTPTKIAPKNDTDIPTENPAENT